MKIAGLDIGTTSAKLTVFDKNGEKLGKISGRYATSREGGGGEIDAVSMRDSILSILREAARTYPDVAGIGLTSFGESFVAVDGEGEPLFPILLYTDPRGAEQCDALVRTLGPARVGEITGLRPHGMYSLPKIMYYRDTDPSRFSRVRYIMLIADYIGYILTGRRFIDYSLATRTMAFDVRARTFSGKILDAAGIDKDMLSEPCETGTVIGTVTPKVAGLTGLSPDCKIIMTGHDQIAACVGAGLGTPGCAVDGSGTVECVTPMFDAVPDGTVLRENNYNLVPYRDSFVTYAFTYTGGALLDWCANRLCAAYLSDAEAAGVSLQTYLENKYPYKITGKLVLPHFAGAATPYMDTGSKGAILGLTVGDGPEDLYFACMEGVAYEMRLNIETLSRAGGRVRRLIATGGGAKSPLWTQIKASVTGLDIDVLETEDAGTVGCAMQAGIAVGAFCSEEEAAARMVKKIRTVSPDPVAKAVYDGIYARYQKLYGAVRPLV